MRLSNRKLFHQGTLVLKVTELSSLTIPGYRD